MKAIRIEKNGDAGVLKLQEVPKPSPGPGEALVRIKAAGLNFIDIYQRSGRYSVPLPYTPGLEGSGVVEEIGSDVREVKPGDRVAYTLQLGSYAQYNLVKAAQLVPLPDELTFEQGAAFPLQGMTAHYLLTEYVRIQPGQTGQSQMTVLVHAAAGGVGLLLVQWLAHLGVRVIGTVSTEEKARIASEAGARDVIVYTREDFVASVRKLTDGKGVDLIYDGVGRATFPGDLDAVAFCGHIVLFGSASGPADPVGPNLFQAKSLSVHGGTLFNYLRTREELLNRAGDVLKGIHEGWLKLRIDQVLPLAEAAEAHRILESRKSAGKLVLNVT